MTDKEKIRVEIERLISRRDEKTFLGIEKISALKEVLSFIDSMQEDPVSEELEQEIDKYVNIPDNQGLPDLRRELSDCAHHFVNWQKQKDQETIELAEDHAMFAGIIKGTEHTISKVRSILNKVAYKNDCLDVNGDYCEQPYVELDNEFKKLLNDN